MSRSSGQPPTDRQTFFERRPRGLQVPLGLQHLWDLVKRRRQTLLPAGIARVLLRQEAARR
jgi:hypothetical protein